MGFCADYKTVFTSTQYHLVKNRLKQFLERGKTSEIRAVELNLNGSHPDEPN